MNVPGALDMQLLTRLPFFPSARVRPATFCDTFCDAPLNPVWAYCLANPGRQPVVDR